MILFLTLAGLNQIPVDVSPEGRIAWFWGVRLHFYYYYWCIPRQKGRFSINLSPRRPIHGGCSDCELCKTIVAIMPREDDLCKGSSLRVNLCHVELQSIWRPGGVTFVQLIFFSSGAQRDWDQHFIWPWTNPIFAIRHPSESQSKWSFIHKSLGFSRSLSICLSYIWTLCDNPSPQFFLSSESFMIIRCNVFLGIWFAT